MASKETIASMSEEYFSDLGKHLKSSATHKPPVSITTHKPPVSITTHKPSLLTNLQ